MKVMNIVVLIFISLSFNCCNDKENHDFCEGEWDSRLKVANQSDSSIWAIHSAGYPDTNSVSAFKNYKMGETYILPNSSKTHYELCTWEAFFDDYVNSDTLMIFIVKSEVTPEDIIKNNGLNQLINNHSVLKRFDLTLDDLKNMNWTITYP